MLKHSSILGLFALIIYSALSIPQRSAAQKLTSTLYTIQGDGKAVADKSSIASVREAEITFGSSGQELKQQARLTLPLFDGKFVEAAVTETETRSADDITWRGRIKYASVDGDAIVTFRKGFYAVYEIVPRGDKHFLVELDQSRFPACGGGLKGDESSVRTSAPNNLAGFDSADRIDVLVVYTTATKNILGGDAQAQAHAQAAVDAANTAYINSKIRQRLRMVHSQEYLYAESGNSSTDLSNLRADASIATLRNAHNADLVSEISEVSGVCGIGYLMGGAGGNQNNAFTVTARSCAVGNLSFAHELGHNMGSQHNPENGSGPTFPYGFGHYVNGSYRTVMSYVDPCTSGCTRVAYFSNPNVIFNNAPTGINNARDNARSINNTGDTIAAYRYSGSSIMLLSYNGGEALPRLVSRILTWTSDSIAGNVRIDISRDESTNWETLIASTPNDGAEAITVGGRATRRARIRVVSLDSPTVSDSSVSNISIR
ncbi:MAG: M12 family metallo-peptidase [Acidobacteriota bacterium]